jgi:hypothetical protein
MATRNLRYGLSRIEVIVLLIGSGIAAALMLPMLFCSAPESSKRIQCTNNLKNISLALESYHNTFRTFPMGVTHAGDPLSPRIGPSWWYAIMPFMDRRDIYEAIARTQASGFEPAGVEFTFAGMPDTETARVQTRLRILVPEIMRCPSSPLPIMENRNGYLMMPSYVGIAGGCDIAADSTDYIGCPDAPQPERWYRNRAKGTGPNDSIVTSSGMLPPAQHVRMDDCRDGTSNTMIVAEQSDWLRDVSRNIATRYHGDPGWNTQTDRQPGGWLTGTTSVAPIAASNVRAESASATEPGDWHADLLFNLTTVRYRPDLKHVMRAPPDAPLPGCGEVMGHNNPLQSPHPGGLLVAFVDGSVHFISGTTDLAVLLRIAIRDDAHDIQFDAAGDQE